MRCGLVPLTCAMIAIMTAPALPAQSGDGQQQFMTVKPEERLVRTDTPSGFPVPRFVSLKEKKTYCRRGPAFEQPIRFTYLRKALPLLVIAETRDHWRKIRDSAGEECWVHKTKLSGERTVLISEEGLILRAKPSEDATARARLASGVIAQLEAVSGNWRRIDAGGGIRGWANVQGLWGTELFATETAPRD